MTKIKIKVHDPLCRPFKSEKGDWIDLRAASDIDIICPRYIQYGLSQSHEASIILEYTAIPLGVSMELPKGYEAICASRSSSYKQFGTILANGIGVIDNSYKGNKDIWHYLAIGLKPGRICKGDRICQFRIQLTQDATVMQKIKWLFSKKVQYEFVDSLDNPSRGGIGSTGK